MRDVSYLQFWWMEGRRAGAIQLRHANAGGGRGFASGCHPKTQTHAQAWKQYNPRMHHD